MRRTPLGGGPLNGKAERSEPGLSLAVEGEGLCQGCVVSRRTEGLLVAGT
jgi:hypothetical protein